jgi:hypothetical protein
MFEQICTLTRKMRELMLGENPPQTAAALLAAAIAASAVPESTTNRPPVKVVLGELAAAVLAGKSYTEQHPVKAATMSVSVVALFDAASTYTPDL